MPIPRPETGETKDGYIARCTKHLVSEGREEEEAKNLALSKWEATDEENSAEIEYKMQKYLLEAMPRRSNQYRKDCIREGDFVNVNTGEPLEITRERLEKWAANFQLMKVNGVNVPIADGHNTEKPLGSITDMEVVDDTDGKARLWCNYDFADEEAVKIAKRAKYVSIATDPDYMDCEGNEYGEVIQHVAVTATPVITKQLEYVQLSRSENVPNKEDAQMAEILREFAELMGIELADDMADDAIKEMVVEKLSKLMNPEQEELADEADETKPVEEAEEEESEEEEQEEEDEEEDAPKLSRELAEALAESAEVRINALVAEGHITPAVGKDLRLSMIGKDIDNVNQLCLSKGDRDRSIVNMVIDILAKNDPVELAKKTEAQIMKDGVRVVKSLEVSEAERMELERQKIEEDMKKTIAKK